MGIDKIKIKYGSIIDINYRFDSSFKLENIFPSITVSYSRNMIPFLSFKNVKIFKFACSVYKSLYDLAPHTLGEFITFKSNISRRVTTASNALSILIKKTK